MSADLTSMTAAPVCKTVAAHLATTVVDITGSGLLIGARNANTATIYLICVQVDGGDIYQQRDSGGDSGLTFFLMPFHTSLKISTNAALTYAEAEYLLS